MRLSSRWPTSATTPAPPFKSDGAEFAIDGADNDSNKSWGVTLGNRNIMFQSVQRLVQRRARPLGHLVVVSVLLWLASTVAAIAQPKATALRVGDHLSMTRLVIDFSENVEHRVFTLADPYRVVIDFPEVEWSLPEASTDATVGLIERYRYGLFAAGQSRLVLDVSEPVAVKAIFVLPPSGRYGYRFVLDLEKTSTQAFETHRRAQPRPQIPPQSAAEAAPSPPVKKSKPVIVIDPGHGGVDPGTIGVSGTYEKGITLGFSREIERHLLATGRYEVILTRDRDIFLRLRERVSVSRNANADLFLSIHADSVPNPRARGASVYTLSEKASDKEAAALAAKENKADLIAGIDLTHENPVVANILIDLAQRETMNISALFAKDLIGEIGREARLLRNTHRFAGFAVLKAPDVPSVLIELGYLSNPHEERQLRDPAYRTKLTKAIARAVDVKFSRTGGGH